MNCFAVAEHHRGRLSAQRLQSHFGKALGPTHDVGRAHSLVSGDQHEVLNTRLHRSLRGIERTHHIIQYALGDVVLNNGHVLVGCGMVDGIHLPGPHHIKQPGDVPY
ncbi:hypothetical protein D3C81_1770560 [compost metagenome]